ncbi:uncharacterized protein Tco025E_03743 [Trypanosoma conorhini]|uniref:Uncharacterized protein n=1 Tax=Trypanosoma conorhini TaxID=83891 RepID=A0A422PRY0_9TRYP|nr:uncharacterized protein Tco025E_03743 [Trypanosoma conorhini]RNF20515.1 hypothetical protein Tco025E_03743 [Trypanosoma conorhini]
MTDEEETRCVDLRQSWRTFMVPRSRTRAGRAGGGGCGNYTLLRRFRVVGTEADDQPLFFLSLISPNRELLSATAHLFVQFNAQFRDCVKESENKMTTLRDLHEQQLTDLLEAANRDTKDMLVGSELTQRFVLRHQEELEELQQECRESERSLELELRQGLLAFLKTSAPDALTALTREKLRVGVDQGTRITNISHFVPSPVPVRTVELPNLLRYEKVGVRAKDISLRPVVVDVSPTSFLQTCLTSLCSEDDDTAPAVTEHLLRLSQQTHAVLLLIGSRAEAETLLSTQSAELLLDNSFYSWEYPRFASLRRHRYLKLMLSTRFWGANIILLWTPPKEAGPPSGWPFAVEDALNLAFSWNADMFSVAVMTSSSYWHAASFRSSTEQAQDVAMAVLRQLQRGVARLAHEAAGVKLSTTWGMPEAPATQAAPQPQRWDDGYAANSPASAGMPQLAFNTNIAIRAFFPFSVSRAEGEGRPSSHSGALAAAASFPSFLAEAGSPDGEAKTEGGRQRRSVPFASVSSGESFSSDLAASREGDCRSQQPMSFKKLLVYTFGKTVVVH